MNTEIKIQNIRQLLIHAITEAVQNNDKQIIVNLPCPETFHIVFWNRDFNDYETAILKKIFMDECNTLLIQFDDLCQTGDFIEKQLATVCVESLQKIVHWLRLNGYIKANLSNTIDTCSNCGSPNISKLAWINTNQDNRIQFFSEYNTRDLFYCWVCNGNHIPEQYTIQTLPEKVLMSWWDDLPLDKQDHIIAKENIYIPSTTNPSLSYRQYNSMLWNSLGIEMQREIFAKNNHDYLTLDF